MNELERLSQAIEHLESQRATLGDEVVEAALIPLQEKIAGLEAQAGFPEQQRKQVTILFTDIVESTMVASHLDPEDTRDIFDSALQRLAKPIEQHNGHVTRFMGDGFKAVFGSPQSHENDPEQAVRAGLEILSVAQELADELREEWQIEDFQVRVGVNTGLVAVGGTTEAEDTLMGSPVNLATRIESAASPGGLLISHNSYRHIRGIFDIEPLEPITAKGFDQPVPVYQVLGVKPRTLRIYTRGVEGIETRMIGREPEFTHLQNARQTAITAGQGQMITISGEAGFGKSRLLFEYLNWRNFYRNIFACSWDEADRISKASLTRCGGICSPTALKSSTATPSKPCSRSWKPDLARYSAAVKQGRSGRILSASCLDLTAANAYL